MGYQNFTLEVSGGIAVFTIDRQELRNALNEACWNELGAFAEQLDRDDSIRLAILTGAGDKAFIAGADVDMVRARTAVGALQGVAQNVLRRLARCEKPTIAAVNGYAFGGGCEVAMACDIRIASKNARFSLPELGLGILPGGGGTQRLAKLIGLGRAMEMILTGRAISAEEALRYGLVSAVTERDRLLEACRTEAEAILSKGPLAVRLAKKVVSASMSTDQDAGMLLELLSYSILAGSADKEEGVSAFLEKRLPRFEGR